MLLIDFQDNLELGRVSKKMSCNECSVLFGCTMLSNVEKSLLKKYIFLGWLNQFLFTIILGHTGTTSI